MGKSDSWRQQEARVSFPYIGQLEKKPKKESIICGREKSTVNFNLS